MTRFALLALAALSFGVAASASARAGVAFLPTTTTMRAADIQLQIPARGSTVVCRQSTIVVGTTATGAGTVTAGTGSTFTACASPFGGGFTVTQPQGWTTTLAPLTTGDTTNGVEMVFSLPNGGVRIASVLPCSFELTGTQTDLDPVTPTRTPDLFSLNGLNINGTVTGLRVANAVGCGTLRDGDLARIQANYAFDTGISGRVTP